MITSYKNPKIKIVRDLLDAKKYRENEQMFVLEGVRLAEEAINKAVNIHMCFFSDSLSDRGKMLLEQVSQRTDQIEELPQSLMDRLSDTQHAQGILLVCGIPDLPFPQLPTLLIALDRINDPGNIGTILRTAAALHADGILLTPGTTDPYSPKALRAAMGAQLHLPIRWQDASDIKATCTKASAPLALVSSVMDCTHACWDVDLTAPLCLVIGNEANGISDALLSLSDSCVRIPIADNTESFNAAIAAAILMYEIERQRNKK